MDSTIFWTLVVDGVVNGTIYALLAIGLVLVFVVTRVILLPQGVYVSFAALTLNQFQRGNVPGTVGLLLALGTRGIRDRSAAHALAHYAALAVAPRRDRSCVSGDHVRAGDVAGSAQAEHGRTGAC